MFVILYQIFANLVHEALTQSHPVSLENLNEIGAKSGEIIVFKTTDDRVMWDGEHPDKTGLAFDYMGAKNELVIVDIKF